MNTNIVSGCHTLELIPINRLTRFARINSRAVILTLGDAEPAKEVPGSVKISTSNDKGIIKKKITFERTGVSSVETDILNSYKTTRLVATYIDETGNRRVAGCPDYPLTLDFSISDGVYSCVLEGEDTELDAFL